MFFALHQNRIPQPGIVLGQRVIQTVLLESHKMFHNMKGCQFITN